MLSSNPAAAEPPPDGEIVAATVPAQPSWWTAESSSAAADGTAADDAVADSGAADGAAAHEPANHADGDNMAALSAGGWARWPTVLERYYTTYTTSNHQLIHQHSNGLILLGVSPSHPQLQPPRRVVEVAYRSGDGKSLANLAVSGKKKSGASFFTARDMVCAVTVDDGSSFTVYACVRGSVIEVNERLRAEPQLLGTAAGFIAVLAPKADEKKSIGQALVEFDQGTAAFSAPSGNEKRRLDGKQVRSSGNKKARREKAAGSDVCFAFQRTGECRWGDKCRYSHIVDASAAGGGGGGADVAVAVAEVAGAAAGDAAAPAPAAEPVAAAEHSAT